MGRRPKGHRKVKWIVLWHPKSDDLTRYELTEKGRLVEKLGGRGNPENSVVLDMLTQAPFQQPEPIKQITVPPIMDYESTHSEYVETLDLSNELSDPNEWTWTLERSDKDLPGLGDRELCDLREECW